MQTGYVIMPRSLLTALSPTLRPLSAFLFIHLYGRANWQEGKWDSGGEVVTIHRGELVTSQAKIREQTGMSRQEVRTALAALERNGFINQVLTKRYTLIRIVNYDDFARDIYTNNESQPSLNQVPTTIEEGKKRVKATAIADKIVDTVRLSQFEELWKKYPRPLGKKEALKHFLASVKEPADWDDIQWALTCYLAEIKRDGTTMEFIQHGKTWFNNWRDWVRARPAPKPKPTPKPQEPEGPAMTPEEMEQIRRENMSKFVPAQEVQDLVTRLAGGASMNPEKKT